MTNCFKATLKHPLRSSLVLLAHTKTLGRGPSHVSIKIWKNTKVNHRKGVLYLVHTMQLGTIENATSYKYLSTHLWWHVWGLCRFKFHFVNTTRLRPIFTAYHTFMSKFIKTSFNFLQFIEKSYGSFLTSFIYLRCLTPWTGTFHHLLRLALFLLSKCNAQANNRISSASESSES